MDEHANGGSFVRVFVELYGRIHAQLRAEVSALDHDALAWTPGPDTNSISTIVVHLLGNETEALRLVRGIETDRDRAAEFSAPVFEPDELLRRIDAADELLKTLGPQVTDEDLTTERRRPSAVRNPVPRSGMFWLLNSYGHAREHLAHVQLTRQLLPGT